MNCNCEHTVVYIIIYKKVTLIECWLRLWLRILWLQIKIQSVATSLVSIFSYGNIFDDFVHLYLLYVWYMFYWLPRNKRTQHKVYIYSKMSHERYFLFVFLLLFQIPNRSSVFYYQIFIILLFFLVFLLFRSYFFTIHDSLWS